MLSSLWRPESMENAQCVSRSQDSSSPATSASRLFCRYAPQAVRTRFPVATFRRPPHPQEQLQDRSLRARMNERGFVLLWAALMLTVLMGMAGLAVDVGNWYLKIQRAQRAADSAAL